MKIAPTPYNKERIIVNNKTPALFSKINKAQDSTLPLTPLQAFNPIARDLPEIEKGTPFLQEEEPDIAQKDLICSSKRVVRMVAGRKE
jgi:hypothetical protein